MQTIEPEIRSGLEIRRFSSIHEIPESLWDGLLHQDLQDDHPYHAHRLIRAVEDARVEDSRFWALVIDDGEQPVGSAMLSAFTVSLDLFLGSGMQRFAAFVRRWLPRFLRVDVLVCGLPASFGQKNLIVSDAAQLDLVVREMEDIARTAGLRFLCLKEFKAHELPRVEHLERLGFFRGYSIPYMSMEIRWGSFDEFLASLRHSYRRHILRSLARKPRLVHGGPEVVSPARFHELYGNVMQRAETRLETLNEAFFERLWVELGSELQIIAAADGDEDGDEILGAALLVRTGTTMNFMLVGLPPEPRTPHDVYFNLLYAIVDQAIRQGCRRLNLGQTATWGKQQIGGQPEDEFLFFKAANPLMHALLRGMRGILFPRLRLPSPRVFK